MYEAFGARQVGSDPHSGLAQFSIFLPDRTRDPSQYAPSPVEPTGAPITDYGDPKIKTIQVAGDFQHQLGQTDWDFAVAPHLTKEPHPKGWLWTYQTPVRLSAGFYEYKYLVTFQDETTRKVSDPCTRYGGTAHQNAAFVIGGSHSTVRPLPQRLPLRDLVLYELMIDDFTDEFRGARAPLDAVRDQLDYLARLGINAILFMPWTAWPGESFNWGYIPHQYFSVEFRYAHDPALPAEKLSWLKQLISECHDRGIHVIMDGVFNHVSEVQVAGESAYGFSYPGLYRDPRACPYIGRFVDEFPGLTDLDFHNGCTEEFIQDVCFYWIDAFAIDGIRFDNTVNFVDAESGGHIRSQKGLPRLLQAIQDHVTARGEANFSLTLEHLKLNAAPITNQTAATSYWNDGLYQRCFDGLHSGTLSPGLMAVLNTHPGLQEDKVATTYLSNHDHSHLAWQAGRRDDRGSLQWYRAQPYLLALLTAPGVPMLQNGEEFAEDHWLVESDEGTGRRIKPRPLHWSYAGDRIGRQASDLYRRLIALRRAHPALRSNNIYPDRWEDWQTRFNPAGYGVDVERGLLIYHRWGQQDNNGRLERFIVALNTSGTDRQVEIPFSVNGPWIDLLNGGTVEVHNFRSTQTVNSYWGRIFHQSD